MVMTMTAKMTMTMTVALSKTNIFLARLVRVSGGRSSGLARSCSGWEVPGGQRSIQAQGHIILFQLRGHHRHQHRQHFNSGVIIIIYNAIIEDGLIQL